MKITKITVIFIIIGLLLLNACKSTEISYNVINIKDAKGIRNHTIMYFLPKTVIQTKVEIKRTVCKAGEYSKFAKKYLNIDNVIKKDNEKWEIVDINFSTYPVIDSSKLFLLEHNDNQDISLKLTKCGILKTINDNNNEYIIENNNNGIKNIYSENIIRTVVKPIHIYFDEIPLPKQVVNSTTVSEKARVLADKILTLREDKAVNIVGDGYSKNIPDEQALSIMIENINKLEKQYLSLFKGKTISKTYTYTFDFIPEGSRKITQKILFRFSHRKGIVPNNDMDGKPAIVEIRTKNNVNQIVTFDKKQSHLKRVAEIENLNKGFQYNIPDIVNVSLLFEDDKLSTKNILLAQFGVIQNLPNKYLNGNYAIKLNAEFGSINEIRKINKVKSEK